ncbi:MAG: PD-(D/E)XK nuclease family protein [Bacteroidales bacterium]|nr:PD-(D/E)XK nuclease family protein [Bacteroidales bacterium]
MISQSQINCYINCSKKYQYKYILKLKPSNETTPENIIIGKLLHKIIEIFISEGVEPSDDNLIKIFIKELPDFCFKIDYEKVKDFLKDVFTYDYIKIYDFLLNNLKENYLYLIENRKEELKTKTNIYLSTFNLILKFRDFILTEIKNGLLNDYVKFETEKQIVFNDLQGFCDLICYDNDFTTTIIDFKTSKRDYKFDKKIQDILYSYIIYKNTNEIPFFEYIAIKYSNKINDDFILTRQKISYNENDFEIIEDFLDNFKRGVEANVFLRNESSFLCSKDFCEYYNECQKYKLEPQNENE